MHLPDAYYHGMAKLLGNEHKPHPLEHNDKEVLYCTHNKYQCRGRACTIHRMSDHHLRSFPQHWRDDRGFMERLCPHGIGHPDPDEFPFWAEEPKRHEGAGTHGCDGCCAPPSAGTTT